MNYKTTWEIHWIDNQGDLERTLPILEQEDQLSIDTETVGWETGNEILCLVQIAAPTVEQIYLIDVLAFPEWVRIEPLISQPKPAIIAHNAPFEQRQFARFGIKTRGIIDTLKMAKNLRSDLPNRTLKTCCKLILDLDISKAEQTSNWEKRPLTPEQIEYAALDTEVTYKLYQELASMEEQLRIDSSKRVPDLMKDLYQTEQEYYALIHDIAARLELLRLRKEMLKDAIRSKLIEGEEPYSGEYGSVAIQRIKRTEINPEKVRELMPEIADLAIKESVQRQRIKELIEEYGLSKDLLERATEILRYDDRLKLNLADF